MEFVYMCLGLNVAIRPRNASAAKRVFVGCGHCEECRSAYKQSWCFRLRAEIDDKVNKGWNVVFWTMTYSDECLPHLTEECFRSDYLDYINGLDCSNSSEAEEYCAFKSFLDIPCFSRDDIESFVHSVREWLWREYDYKQVSYFIAGEYGSDTKRPHYHGLMCVPPSVDTDRLHSFICQQWTPKGHVFPRYAAGGRDSHGYEHKPFVVRSPAASARYAAKYAVKDLYYDEMLVQHGLDDSVLDLDSRDFKRSMCFHVQTKSLGACILDGLSDLDKLDLIRIGYAFAGDTEFSKIPVYIRNKLIYDNKYIFVKRPMTGERVLGDVATHEDCNYHRLVTREANEFFKTYSKEIFEAKVLSWTQLLADISDVNNYKQRNTPPSVAASAVMALGKVQSLGCSMNMAATLFLLYYGVDEKERIYACRDDSHLVYLNRYCKVDLSRYAMGYHSEFVNIVLDCVHYAICCYYYTPIRRSELQRLSDRIRDYFGHLE